MATTATHQSGLAPRPSNNLLITSEAEHMRLIAEEVCAQSIPVFHVADLVAQYAHDKSLTIWHTALSRLKKLPEQIPLLCLNVDHIYPIRGSFYLIPRGTLNEFEAIVSAYGQEHLAAFGGENPLQFRDFWNLARQEHGNTQCEKDEWGWMSDDVLDGSRNQTYPIQAQIVAKLGANFKIPSLGDAAKCLFLRQVATRERVLQAGNEQNGGLSTFTRVQETTLGSFLVLGASAPTGVYVARNFVGLNVGVVAFQKF